MIIETSPNTISAGGRVLVTAEPANGQNLAFVDTGGYGTIEAFEAALPIILVEDPSGRRWHFARRWEGDEHFRFYWSTSAELQAGAYTIHVSAFDADEDEIAGLSVRDVSEVPKPEDLFGDGDSDVGVEVVQVLSVTLRRAQVPPTTDQALWTAIRAGSNALSFASYSRFMDAVMCGEDGPLSVDEERAAESRGRIARRLRLPFPDTDAYRQLKVATEVFVMLNCGVATQSAALSSADVAEEERRGRLFQPGGIEQAWADFLVSSSTGADETVHVLPYLALIRRKLGDVSISAAPSSRLLQAEEDAAVLCSEILNDKLTNPSFLELIWSYWHEEGMLAQTMNAIAWRFQNRRGPGERDPLAFMEIDPLRPLNNFIWGYVQDAQHRLSVARRSYEYDHHYGVTLLGPAGPSVRGGDSRSRFVEAFHHLLHLCSTFYKEDDDTTVIADALPLLHGVKEVHVLLAQGAHNQFGDLPSTARQEMLVEQWLLARPELRESLPRRIMVAYPEEWMASVDTMKGLQGWTETSIVQFRDLGVFGEQILLSIRFGAWSNIIDADSAANWARYWRPEVQGYIHAYRAATGVDLAHRPDATMPAILLRRRLPMGLAPDTTAPQADGIAEFSRSGLATVLPNRRSVTVAGVLLNSASLILATTQGSDGGTVARCIPNVADGSFKIRLSKTSTQPTRVAWFVVN